VQDGAVFAEVVDAANDVIVGATMRNATGVDAPPPPPVVGLNTVTWADPTVRMSAAGMAAVSCCVALMMGWQVSAVPRTNEQGKKLLPVTLSVRAAVPAVHWPQKRADGGHGKRSGCCDGKVKSIRGGRAAGYGN